MSFFSSGRRRRLTAMVSVLVLAGVALPAPAAARMGYGGSPYDYSFTPTRVVVPDYSLLRVGDQFYPPTAKGLRELCLSQPQLCLDAGVQADLLRLERLRRASNGLFVASGVTLLSGLGVLFWWIGGRPRGSTKPIIAGSLVGAGLVSGIVGSALRPDRGDVRGVVNSINRAHHDTPVQWSLLLAPWGSGMVGGLAAAF